MNRRINNPNGRQPSLSSFLLRHIRDFGKVASATRKTEVSKQKARPPRPGAEQPNKTCYTRVSSIKIDAYQRDKIKITMQSFQSTIPQNQNHPNPFYGYGLVSNPKGISSRVKFNESAIYNHGNRDQYDRAGGPVEQNLWSQWLTTWYRMSLGLAMES